MIYCVPLENRPATWNEALFYNFFRYVNFANFEVASDSFATFKVCLLTIKTFCARFMVDVFWNSSTRQPLPTFYTWSMFFFVTEHIEFIIFTLKTHYLFLLSVCFALFSFNVLGCMLNSPSCLIDRQIFALHLLFCFSLPGSCSFFVQLLQVKSFNK